eukprot:8353492-Alexandrium_andersonii.AAC.1
MPTLNIDIVAQTWSRWCRVSARLDGRGRGMFDMTQLSTSTLVESVQLGLSRCAVRRAFLAESP